jgi:hypothetical protein
MTPAQQDLIPAQIASQAEFIVENLQHTDYQHTDNIDVDSGVYDCDCNGFVGFVLKNAAPAQNALVPNALRRYARNGTRTISDRSRLGRHQLHGRWRRQADGLSVRASGFC